MIFAWILVLGLGLLAAWLAWRLQQQSHRSIQLQNQLQELTQSSELQRVNHEKRLLTLQLQIETTTNELDQIQQGHLLEIQDSLRSRAELMIASELESKWEAAEADFELKAKQLMINVMERTSMDVSTAQNTASVEIPSEDVKGRIIGREGRNIRSFEQITGVDLIIDETPETVMISSFDPVRREIARITLLNLIVDGRIHPAKIEEWHQKATVEVEKMLLESAKKAATESQAGSLPKPVLETLGKLRLRSSYAQNVLDHSVEVAKIGAMIASELGLDVKAVRRAGLLHDIGKALDETWEGPHAIAGMNFLKQFQETEMVLNAVGAHHREIEPSTPEAQVVLVADVLSASRPGARSVSHEDYLQRMKTLEELANEHPGVDKSFVVQAGREIRVLVKPEVMNDQQARALAKEIGDRISRQKQFGGQIKITVIRETRFIEIVK